MDDGTVKKFTNVSDEEFTHQYHGQSFTIGAGESKVFPTKLAEHLAKHLTSRVVSREANAREAALRATGEKGAVPITGVTYDKELEKKTLKAALSPDEVEEQTGQILGQVPAKPAVIAKKVALKAVETTEEKEFEDVVKKTKRAPKRGRAKKK